MFRSFGPAEILLILGILFLLFGASRLPQMGNSLGRGLREFKNGIMGATSGEDTGEADKETKQALGKDESSGA